MNELNIDLQKRIEAFIKANTPIESNGKTLSIEKIRVTVPKELNDYEAQIQMKYSRNSDLRGAVRGVFVVRDKKTGKVLSKSNERDICPFYYATDRNTYVVNGVERIVLNKMVRKPGIYTRLSGEGATSDIRFASSKETNLEYVPGISMSFIPNTSSFKITVGKTAYSGVAVLRAFGFSDNEIVKAMGNNEIADAVLRKDKAVVSPATLYKQVTGKDCPFTAERDIQDGILAFLSSNASFGTGDTVKATIGVQKKTLDKSGILRTVERLFAVSRNAEKPDDTDDIRFKNIMNPNDQILEKFQQDFAAFSQRAKKDLESDNNNVYGSLYNMASVKKSSITGLLKGDMSDTADQNSPLTVEGYRGQVTQLADGLTESSAPISMRKLKGMSMNRIDPVDTPENKRGAGLIEHFTEAATVKNGTILIPVLKVSGGKAQDTARNTVEIDPTKEFDSKVAFHDLRFVKKEGGSFVLFSKTGEVPGRYKGQNVNLRIAEVQYLDKRPNAVFGEFANMIPFVTNDDGNRVTFGSKMQRQSMVLKNRELPLVSSLASNGKTYEENLGEKYGKPVLSQVAGVVSRITKDKIMVKGANGKEIEHPYYNYFPLNQGYINNEIRVSIGQTVKAGDILAEGWQTKDGKLATGVNAKVAFMAYKGYNYEDGLVVSEAFAKKMSVEDVQTIEFDIKRDWEGGRGSDVRKKLLSETNNQEVFTNLDKDGIIKEGLSVKEGSILAAFLQPVKEEDSILSLFSNPSKKKQKQRIGYWKIPSGSYVAGQVKRVVVVGGSGDAKQTLVVTVVQSKPLKVGDKLAGKHGNKGTISLIVPDVEMPTRADGEKLEVLYSCAAVPSRKNLGQILETNAGLVAEKTGKPIVVNNFDPNNTEKVKKALEKIGVPDGKMKVTLHEMTEDGKVRSIEADNPVVVGDMYMMKLIHKVDDKIQARVGDEKGTAINRQTNMPNKSTGNKEGERHNPMSLDSMATDALIGHQAVWNILESTTIKADGGGDAAQRAAMFNAIKTGKLDGLDQYSAVPETLNVLAKKLKALGLNVTPLNNGKKVRDFSKEFDAVRLSPMKPSEMMKQIGKQNEVTEKRLLDPKANGVNARAKNGLADERIFGDLDDPASKNRWGYINLVTPVANPVYAGQSKGQNDIYSLLTGYSHREIASMSQGKLVVVADPDTYTGKAFKGLSKKEIEIERKKLKQNMTAAGLSVGQLIEPAKLEALIAKHGEIIWKTGNEGILSKLDSVDISQALRQAKKDLKKSSSAKSIDENYRKVKALEMLKSNGMEASDLMMKYIPVMPLYLRDPGIKQGDTVFKIDSNTHYGNIISHNNTMKKTIENGTDMYSFRNPKEAAKETGRLYDLISGLTGHLDKSKAVDFKTKQPIRGITQELAEREGLIHSKMMKKRQDFSARSVIGVDPNLGIDDVGLPIDIAKTVFKLEIIRDLVATGKAVDEVDAERKWQKTDTDTVASLKKLAKSNPVLINRSPSLHKFSVQAFNPVIKENKPGLAVRNIQLNPLIVTGFNADFDGDQMSVYVPITKKAKDEARKKLMPSQNLISETSGKMIPSIRHEMALGIYYLTMDADQKSQATPLKVANVATLRRMYKEGKIKPGRMITISISGTGQVTCTAGAALVNSYIPARYRNFTKSLSSGDIGAMFKKMYDDMETTNGRDVSKRDIVECMENLKTLGFEAATRSGVSLGLNDLTEGKDINKKYGLSKIDKLEGEKRFDAFQKAQDAMEQDLKKGTLLSRKNPVQILLNSGARGSAEQYRRMIGAVGIGKDVTGKLVSPISSSHLSGLSAEDYFLHGNDSRKGLYDRSVSTAKPGAVFKTISSSMQNEIIKEKDCGTSDGIMMKKWHSSLVGRVAAEDVFAKGGRTKLAKRGQVITEKVRDAIVQKAEVEEVKVRSPLRCKTVNGVCAKCYGYLPGEHKFPNIGTPVGVLAAQAIGEPISQGAMNTFHTGGTTGSTGNAITQIETVLGARVQKGDEAIISSITGKVTNIKKGTPGTKDVVFIDGKPINVPHYANGEAKPLRVSVGDYVTKGDFVTVGNIDDIYANKTNFTMANPKTLFETLGSDSKTSLPKTRDYMASALEQTMSMATGGKGVGVGSKIDRRHMELITRRMSDTATITQSSNPAYLKGQTADINEINKWNANNAGLKNARVESIANASKIVGRLAAETKRKGTQVLVQEGELITSSIWSKLQMAGVKRIKVTEDMIKYSPNVKGIGDAAPADENRWVANLASGRSGTFQREIARASMIGATDTLSDNRSRRMTGKLLRIGEGFSTPKAIANNFSSKLSNFFKRDK